MPALPLCFQNSSSLHMSCFKPNRDGNQDSQEQLTSLPLFLLSLMPSWGDSRLLHHVSKQRQDQDAWAPFLESTNLLLVLCLMAMGRLWLGWVGHQIHKVGWEVKFPSFLNIYCSSNVLPTTELEALYNRYIWVKFQGVFIQLTRVFSSLDNKWKIWGTKRLGNLPKVIRLNQFWN